MSLKEQVYSVLIVSSSKIFDHTIAEMLPASQYQPVCFCTNISEAKRWIATRSFDFIIINAPLPDESGIRFSIDCCRSHTTVPLLLVKRDIHDEVYDKVAEHGVFTLPKPTSCPALKHGFSWMASSRERLRKLEKKTFSIEQRMEEIRIVNRAKFLLISELKMSEEEAHHYIEREAMDHCISKRSAAEKIIKIYT